MSCRSRPSPFALAMWAMLALALLHPSAARAYEDQATLGFGVGWLGAPAAATGVPRNAVSLDVTGTLGVSDGWSLGAHVAYGLHPADPLLHSVIGGVELLYMVDVLQIVPTLGVGVDAFLSVRDAHAGADLAAHALLRVDYLVSRKLMLGADVRVYALPFAFDEGGLSPFAMQAGLRLSLTFDRY